MGETDSFAGVRQSGMVREVWQGWLRRRDRDVVSEREKLSAHLWGGVTEAGRQ